MADLGDDMTELYDADVPRVDLVGKGANGLPFLLMKQDAQGLLDADTVRDLIAKSETPSTGVTTSQEMVTMSGSPAAIAKLIHRAAQTSVEKAEMSSADQNDLPDSDFAYIEPGGHKDDEGKTVPRSKRHFPINDAAHVRNALSRAPQSPFGDKAMPKIRAAAKKYNIDVAKADILDAAGDSVDLDDGVDGMDPTVVLAEPDEDVPGDPTDPGSPAWEAIDAATARKWTTILARAKVALGVMSDRESLEAVTADPDDAASACDLQDAACAIDYAIGVLAPFAVGEQSEADCGVQALEAVGKAMDGWDTAPLDVLEVLVPVAKSGRVVSSANEAAIREAIASLQKIIASLPQAPDASDGGKTAAMQKESTVTDAEEPKTEEPVEKAKGDPQVAVYDESGNLVGTVAPDNITPLAPAHAPETPKGEQTPEAEPESKPAEAPAPPPTDLTPAPAATVGTPADAAADDDDNVTKSTETTDPIETTSDAVLKGSARNVFKAAIDDAIAGVVKTVEDRSAEQAKVIAEQATVIKSLEEHNTALEDRIEALEKAPAVPMVLTNGALPPTHLLRGQDQGAPAVDIAKAREMRAQLAAATDATEQKRIADTMQAQAVAAFQAIHRGQRP